MRWVIIGCVVVLLAGAGAWGYIVWSGGDAPKSRKAALTQGKVAKKKNISINRKETQQRAAATIYDPDTQYEEGEILVANPPEGFENTVGSLGFRITERTHLAELDFSIYRLQLPGVHQSSLFFCSGSRQVKWGQLTEYTAEIFIVCANEYFNPVIGFSNGHAFDFQAFDHCQNRRCFIQHNPIACDLPDSENGTSKGTIVRILDTTFGVVCSHRIDVACAIDLQSDDRPGEQRVTVFVHQEFWQSEFYGPYHSSNNQWCKGKICPLDLSALRPAVAFCPDEYKTIAGGRHGGTFNVEYISECPPFGHIDKPWPWIACMGQEQTLEGAIVVGAFNQQHQGPAGNACGAFKVTARASGIS